MIPPPRSAGFSLAEVLIAVALATMVFIMALSAYEALMKHQARAMRDALLQQSTRAAFNRIVADLRDAGLNHNPEGIPGRRAEPVEGMWEGAVMVRIDGDMWDPARNLSPEASLAGSDGMYGTVSIGNDEIVGYALGKSTGGGARLSFVADVAGVPRDGIQERVSIRNVASDGEEPPFTLYRVVVRRAGTSTIRQPMADDIASLQFSYHDRQGNLLSPAGGDETPVDRSRRAAIASIGVRLVGVAMDPYKRRLHEFALQTRVFLRNAGRVGTVDRDPEKPPAPGNFP